MIIRQSNESDLYRIRKVVSLAFNPDGPSTGTKVVEADLVEALIADKDDTINLRLSDMFSHLQSPLNRVAACVARK